MEVTKFRKFEGRKMPFIYGSFFYLLAQIGIFICFIGDVFDIGFEYNIIGIVIGSILIICSLMNTNLIVKVVRVDYARLDKHKSTELLSIVGLNIFLFIIYKMNDKFIEERMEDRDYSTFTNQDEFDKSIGRIIFQRKHSNR